LKSGKPPAFIEQTSAAREEQLVVEKARLGGGAEAHELSFDFVDGNDGPDVSIIALEQSRISRVSSLGQ
jgi:hypothetical protein